MGEEGFRHGMTPEHLKEIRRLEKENDLLKKLLAEKDIEAHLKDELLKKRIAARRSLAEKKELAADYIAKGLTRDKVLSVLRISKHQYYYKPKAGRKRGRKKSTVTLKHTDQGIISCSNKQVVEQIKEVGKYPDTDYGHRKMTIQLMILGFVLNHKKVYRLMKTAQLLKERQKGSDKAYVKYRIVNPTAPLEVLEMDIKQVWITEHRGYAYILTVVDTFTGAVYNTPHLQDHRVIFLS